MKTRVVVIAVLSGLCLLAQYVFVGFNKGAGGGGGPTFVQACQSDGTGGVGDQTCTFSAGTTSGNGVVIFTKWQDTGSAPTPATGDVTDSSSDSFVYQFTLRDSTDLVDLAVYLAATVTAGTTAITFKNFSNSNLNYSGYPSIIAFEIHGGSRVLDGSASHNMPTGSAAANGDVCSSFTPGTNGDLILMGGSDPFASTTFSAGTSPLSFTIPTNGSSTNIHSSFEYATQSTAASITPAMTASGGTTSNPFNSVCMGIK